MLILNGLNYAAGLGFPLRYTLVLPTHAMKGAKYPLAVCLHDLGESSETLLHSAHLAELADECGMVLALPDGRRSCFLDMAHGPKWTSAIADCFVPQLGMSLGIDTSVVGVVGIGAGALGAMQMCRKQGNTRFICAAIEPEVDMPFVRDARIWPVEREWLGVFDGQRSEWSRDSFDQAGGCIIGTEGKMSAFAARFDPDWWDVLEGSGDTLGDQMRTALLYCRDVIGRFS